MLWKRRKVTIFNSLEHSVLNKSCPQKTVLQDSIGLEFYQSLTKIMASGPITSWEIDGETVETVSDLIFLGSKITADGDCSHEIKDAYSLEEKL